MAPAGPAPPPCYYQALPGAWLQSPAALSHVLGSGLSAGARLPAANISLPAEPGLPPADQASGRQILSHICGQDSGFRMVGILAPGAPQRGRAATAAQAGGPGTPSHASLQTLQAEVSLPSLQIAVNPAQVGITNLASYFWLSGASNAPVYTRAGASPLGSIELRATPLSYLWSFGDGSTLRTTSLGQAYPAVSDIAHTYTVRSDWAPTATPAGLYPVRVTASYDVAFQVLLPGQSLVPNGTWVDFSTYGFPPLQDSAGHDYKVAEVTAQLVG